MKKRTFLKQSVILGTGLLLNPLAACDSNKNNEKENNKDKSQKMSFELPKLNYEYAALEPYIDAQTMEIHHTKHHAGYTKKFNAALEASSTQFESIESLFENLKVEDDQTALRNNGGGFYNHKLFWETIGPNEGGMPNDELAAAIDQSFGSFDNFSIAFKDAAKKRFGSGWAWLIKKSDGKLAVCSTPNQDNPLMKQLVDEPGTPIMGIDVWEHAYYLKYQNQRAAYIDAFFNIINWKKVEANFKAI